MLDLLHTLIEGVVVIVSILLFLNLFSAVSLVMEDQKSSYNWQVQHWEREYIEELPGEIAGKYLCIPAYQTRKDSSEGEIYRTDKEESSNTFLRTLHPSEVFLKHVDK